MSAFGHDDIDEASLMSSLSVSGGDESRRDARDMRLRDPRLEVMARERDSRWARNQRERRDSRAIQIDWNAGGSNVDVSMTGRDPRPEGSRDARDVADLLSDVNARVSSLNRDMSRALRGDLPRFPGSRRDRDNRTRMQQAGNLSTRVEPDLDSLFSDVQSITRSNKPKGNNARTVLRNFFPQN